MLLGLGLLTAGNADDQIQQVLCGLVDGLFAVCDDAGVEVDPARLLLCQRGVGRDLQGGSRSGERRAAAGGEEDEVRACGGHGSGGHEVIAGAVEHIQALGDDGVTIADDVHDGGGAALLDAATALVFQRGDAALLVARRGVVVDDLIVADEVLLEAVDHLLGLDEDITVDAAVHQEALGAEHVDTNKPEMTECPDLLKMTKTIVVFDHHRQSSNMIENTVLSYIEPYASSSCEMVSEVLQYITDDVRITNVEANSMYAGIVIDTNNFMNRTGVRTFEAAAFLRRCGADITYVRKIFRDNMESYRAKAEIVSSAEVFCDEYAIARYENAEIDSPTIIGAQAANELLNIDGIKASFVLTKYNGKIYVSARAIDEVNVQIIMERVGGGGHMNTAGAQFQHTNMEEAIETLKETIYTMKEEGDI